MPKRLLPLFLLLPSLSALAECGFAHGEQGLTIVVSAKSNRCFHSGQFRESFRQTLVASVQAMEDVPPQRSSRSRSFDERSARGAKLWTIAERNHQSNLATASYYGQR